MSKSKGHRAISGSDASGYSAWIRCIKFRDRVLMDGLLNDVQLEG